MINKVKQNFKMYSEKELAEALEISYWTVRTWRLQRGLPHIRTVGRIFYRMEAVLSWMEAEERKNSEQSKAL